MTVTATELYTGNHGIMDTDGHIIEPADLWTGDLMEAKYDEAEYELAELGSSFDR